MYTLKNYATVEIHPKSRLDYQPLFGKMSLHPGRIKDRTRETAEIEPILRALI